jgi:hypothetical protein
VLTSLRVCLCVCVRVRAAPTNEAFAAIPFYIVNYLTAPENANILKAVLLYHVSATAVTSYSPNQKIPSVQGSNFFVEYIDGASRPDAAVIVCVLVLSVPSLLARSCLDTALLVRIPRTHSRTARDRIVAL